MDTSVVLDDSHLQEIKLQMKKWEKRFEKTFGRKASKEDIDKDEKMKQTYIHYWRVVKNKIRNQAPVPHTHGAKKVNSAWGDDLNKRIISDKKSNSKLTNEKRPLSYLSSKLLQKSTSVPTKMKSFSLKKPKTRDDGAVTINANPVKLFKKAVAGEEESPLKEILPNLALQDEREALSRKRKEDEQQRLRIAAENEKDPFKIEINNIITSLEDESDLKMISKSSEVMTDENCSVQMTFNNYPIDITPSMSSSTTFESHNFVMPNNVHEPSTIYNSSMAFTSDHIFMDMQQPSSSDTIQTSINLNTMLGSTGSNTVSGSISSNTVSESISSNTVSRSISSNTVLRSASSTSELLPSFTTFNEYAEKTHLGYQEHSSFSYDFTDIIPPVISSMNEENKKNTLHESTYEFGSVFMDSHCTPSATAYDIQSHSTNVIVSTCESYEPSPDASYLNLDNTTNSRTMFTPIKKDNYKSSIDFSMDFSPLKEPASGSLIDQVKLLGVPLPKKSFEEKVPLLVRKDQLFEESDDDEDASPMDTFEGVKTAASTLLFDVNLELSQDSSQKIKKSRRKIISEEDGKLDVKSITKQRKGVAQKDNNFRRLDFKKKVFVRGHKKFNSSKYKKDEWKKLQNNRGTGCFKCGDPGHWAQDCLRDFAMDDNAFDAELEDLAIEKNLGNPLQALTNQTAANLLDLENEHIEEEVDQALKDLGFEQFKPNQRETILRILKGQSVLMISSTGSGKSLCYQLPAYLLGKKKNYVTLVISPLISLMEDQVLCLPKKLKGACLHSGITENQRQKQLLQIQNGECSLLFVSPEYIIGNLMELSLLPPIAFVCIDEAHCLSEWSNNFRPSYLQLFKALKTRLGIQTFLALTATSNKHTTRQIVRNLGISYDHILGQTQIPTNLLLTVSRDANKEMALIDLLKSDRFSALTSIIIYCNRREVTERLATLIRIEMKNFRGLNNKVSWNACAYHAGLSYHTRKEIQNKFVTGELRIIVATIAFGMGINKSDVRAIIHYNLPKTFENYVQEIGRAGRDGQQAECHAFLDHDGSDLYEQQKHIYANGVDRHNIRKFTAKLFKPCKCRTLNSEAIDVPVDLDSAEQSVNESTRENLHRCPGHEKAFSIKDTTVELDLKEETIMTLLLFLELNCKQCKVAVLNHTNSNCKLFCYRGGGEQMEQLAKQHPVVAMALAQHKREQALIGKFGTPDTLEFSHVDVAAMLGKESLFVRRQLKALEWQQNADGNRIRSSIRVDFSNLSFHVISPGDLSEDELEQISRMLINYSRSQEYREVSALKHMYDTFRELSQQRCTNKINREKSARLKQVLNEYFDLKEIALEEVHEVDMMEEIASQNIELRKVDPGDLNEARSNICNFIRVHHDHHFTPRAIARILQGIASPKFPIETWGKDKRFWRRSLRIDFNLLVKIAHEELIKYKC